MTVLYNLFFLPIVLVKLWTMVDFCSKVNHCKLKLQIYHR